MQEETNNTQFAEEPTPSEEAVAAEELAGNVYNTDDTEVDLERFAEEVRAGKAQSLRGLLITVILLSAGILAVLIFWLIRYKDLFL